MSKVGAWLAFAACCLLAGLVALASATRPAGEQAPAARLVVVVPSPVVAVAVTSAALATLLLFVAVFGQGRRRRSLDDETASPARLRRSLRPIAALLTLAASVYVLWRNPDLAEFLGDLARLGRLDEPGTSSSDAPAAWLPLFTGAVSILALAVGLGSLALVVWVLFGDRIAQWWAGREPDDEHPLVGAVEESLDDLRLERDARVAIIKCYGRFEGALARAEVPRAPWHTPLEFMESALGRLSLPAGAVAELTRLFELARFSDHPLGPAARDAAWHSLLEIKLSLAPENSSAV